MMSLLFAFWLFVVLFAIIGAMRGWAKELLVTFSVILSLAFTRLLEHYVPAVQSIEQQLLLVFWLRTILLLILVFFGYQTVNISRLAGKAAREKLQDILLGGVLGGFNGYLIIGTIWFYMNEAGYPFKYITSPNSNDELGLAALQLITLLPPRLIGEPGIYFLVILAFIFVLVVFI
jgi:colicin V production protein